MEWARKIEAAATGYRESAVLLTAARTGVFEVLGNGSRKAEDLAKSLGKDRRALETMLLALVSSGILTLEKGEFAIVEDARPFLLDDGSESMAAILGHHHSLMRRWAKLDDILSTGLPEPRPEPTPEETRNFILGMENVSRRSSLAVAEMIDLSDAGRLLDLGGGPGTNSIAFARANPGLECVIFDLPEPLTIAEEQIRAAGLEDRVKIRAGDYFTDDLGTGFDVVYIGNIIHSMGPEETLALFRKARAALNDGGRVVLKEFLLEDSRTEPPFAAYFSVNMLVATARGKSYTRTECRELMGRAGFRFQENLPVPPNSEVLIGLADGSRLNNESVAR